MNYITDPAIWTDHLKILTAETLCVPGLEMFGHNSAEGLQQPLAPHLHTTAEFLYFSNGIQYYHADGKEYLLNGNQVLVVNAHVPHSSGDTPFGRHESLWFRLDIRAFAEGLGLPPKEREPVLQAFSRQNAVLIPLQEKLYGTLHTAFYALASPDPVQRFRGYTLFVSFIAQLVLSAGPEIRHSDAIQRVLTHIEENICTQLTLEQLAALSGLSLSGFKQKFRRETGITPREYINLKKIEKARVLLKAGVSVTETAFALDFSSSSYFSVLFRQVEGMSPRAWARLHREEKKGANP